MVYATEVDIFNGELYALDASTGKLLWRGASLPNLRTSAIHVMDNLIYVNGFDAPGTLTAYNAANGARLWRYQADGNSLIFFLLASGENAYSNINDSTLGLQGFLAVLNTRDGSLRWRFPQTGQGNVDLAGAQGSLVYVRSLDDESLYALNASDGSVKWQVRVGLVASASLSSDTLYLSSSDGTIYALNASDGAVRWQVQAGTHHADFDTRVLAASQGLLYVSQTHNGLYALDTGNGSVKWHSATGELALGIDFDVLSISNGVAYVHILNNNKVNGDTLYALNTSDGSPRWSYHVEGSAFDSGFTLG